MREAPGVPQFLSNVAPVAGFSGGIGQRERPRILHGSAAVIFRQLVAFTEFQRGTRVRQQVITQFEILLCRGRIL